MIRLKDAECFDIIADTMRDICVIDTTIEEDLEVYANSKHYNYFTTDGGGFICVQDMGDYIWLAYSHRDERHKTLKELILFAKLLYKRYTIDNKLPIFYAGKRNMFSNHSIKIKQQLWQLDIKR